VGTNIPKQWGPRLIRKMIDYSTSAPYPTYLKDGGQYEVDFFGFIISFELSSPVLIRPQYKYNLGETLKERTIHTGTWPIDCHNLLSLETQRQVSNQNVDRVLVVHGSLSTWVITGPTTNFIALAHSHNLAWRFLGISDKFVCHSFFRSFFFMVA
jgi:hypothetical protein